MRERPILFSGPMVRAILDGTKTQTRRVVKLPHENPLGTWEPTRIGGAGGGKLANGSEIKEQGAIWHTRTGEILACPHGEPGDRLWVREAWQFADWTEDGQPYVRYAADGEVRFCEGAGEGGELVDVWAHLSRPENYEIDNKAADRRWRPSIHTPRWASRITLAVTSVRVERLQDISETDAIAEGCHDSDGAPTQELSGTARGAYALLWDDLNADRSFGWDVNPWVWVVEFRRVANV